MKTHPQSTAGRSAMGASLLVLIAALALFALGCEKDAKTLAYEGNAAMIQKKHDVAIERFNAALALEPDNFDALLGLAEVYIQKNDTAKAKEYFEKASKINTDKGKAQYLEQLQQDMLLQEVKAFQDKTSDAFHEALWAVIKVRDRGEQANEAYTMLGEYYMERGDALAKDPATREKAVEMYLKMRNIRTQRPLRNQALSKAETLQREIYKDKFAQTFEALRPDLEKEGLYDPAARLVKIKVLIEDPEIDPKTDEDKAAFQQKLALQAEIELVKFTYKLSGEPEPAELKRLSYETVKKVDDSEIIEKGKVQLIISVALDELEQLSYDRIVVVAREAREAEARKAEGAPDDKGEAPAPADGAQIGRAHV